MNASIKYLRKAAPPPTIHRISNIESQLKHFELQFPARRSRSRKNGIKSLPTMSFDVKAHFARPSLLLRFSPHKEALMERDACNNLFIRAGFPRRAGPAPEEELIKNFPNAASVAV